MSAAVSTSTLLVDCSPSELRKMPLVLDRVKKVQETRLASPDSGAQKLAQKPMLFRETRNPDNFVAIPVVSSERRKIIPIGYLDGSIIAGNKLFIIPNTTKYHFGVLTSNIHMAWMRVVCGRMKSDYSYSKNIVYNNFPFPTPTEEQKSAIEKTAQGILDARALYPDSSLADLYDPLTMPPVLKKAHEENDKAVEKAYGRKFADEAEIVAYLMQEYQRLVGEKK